MSMYNTIWSNIGTSFTHENIMDALMDADLDFEVSKTPLLGTVPGKMVPDKVGTFRTDTGDILGVVGRNYGIVQNADAFAFADLIDDLTWVHGGYTSTGLAFLVGKLPSRSIKGDTYTPHIIFQNSFNGAWNLRGQVVLVEDTHGYVVNLPGQTEIRIRHSSRAEDRVLLAKQALAAVNKYIADFEAELGKLSEVSIPTGALEIVVSDLFPIKAGATERVVNNQMAKREAFLESYNDHSVTNGWFGTGWGVIKAFADFTTKIALKAAQKSVRKAESAFENSLISGRNYDKLVKAIESL